MMNGFVPRVKSVPLAEVSDLDPEQCAHARGQTHRQRTPEENPHRRGDFRGTPGDQPGNADDQAGGGDDPVSGPEHGRTQPADSLRSVSLKMLHLIRSRMEPRQPRNTRKEKYTIMTVQNEAWRPHLPRFKIIAASLLPGALLRGFVPCEVGIISGQKKRAGRLLIDLLYRCF
jgi:hypothetical protein